METQHFLEGLIDGEIHGWAVGQDGKRARIGLFLGDRLIAETQASRARSDLAEAGLGDVAFSFVVSRTLISEAARTDGEVELRRLNGDEGSLGRVTLPDPDDAALFDGDAAKLTTIRKHLKRELEVLAETAWAGIEPGGREYPKLERHGPLFAPSRVPDIDAPTKVILEPLPGYLDFVRHRNALVPDLYPEQMAEHRDALLASYLEGYGAHRQGYRVPLGANQIAYLNEPLIMAGRAHQLSRVMWWRLMASPSSPKTDLNLDDRAWINRMDFWWVRHEAPRLQVEDCLIPPEVILRQGQGGLDDGSDSAPMTLFLHHLVADLGLPLALDAAYLADRRLLYLITMVMAVRYPHFLWFLPEVSLRALLKAEEDRRPYLELFLDALQVDRPQGLEAVALYQRALSDRGFDLETLRFRSVLPTGDRLHAASVPVPARAKSVADVQIIGPFQKASGLGQACRLSADSVERSGLSVNRVDFDLDNPALEGFSSPVQLDQLSRARVNILHLNAESVPLAYAYAPDVFSDAYTIGYFFWELDHPAKCHHLALSLLDEVWVSTDWLRDVFAPYSTIPVTNVGLATGAAATVDREGARTRLHERMGFAGDPFTFFFSFDNQSFIQRKNPMAVIQAFTSAFPDDPGVRLVIKSQNRKRMVNPEGIALWAQMDRLINADPRIFVVDRTLPYEDLMDMKAGIDAYVSLHRSEGWGFGMIEAMTLGIPVVCTGYSGNMEFCSDETAWLVDSIQRPVGPREYVLVQPGQHWAEPDIQHAARQMLAVRTDSAARDRKVGAALSNVQARFSQDAIAKRYRGRLDQILAL